MNNKISKEEMKRQQIFTTQNEFLKLGKILAEKEFKENQKKEKIENLNKYLFTNSNIPPKESSDYLKNLNEDERKKIYEKLKIYNSGNIFGKDDNFENIDKFFLSFYEFLDFRNNLIEEQHRKIKILEESIEDFEENSNSFIEDAEIAENKNKKLKLRILKLRQKCIFKNSLIKYMKISLIFFITFFLIEHYYKVYNFLLKFIFLIFNFPFYYVNFSNTIITFIFPNITVIKITLLQFFININIGLFFYYSFKKKDELKNK